MVFLEAINCACFPAPQLRVEARRRDVGDKSLAQDFSFLFQLQAANAVVRRGRGPDRPQEDQVARALGRGRTRRCRSALLGHVVGHFSVPPAAPAAVGGSYFAYIKLLMDRKDGGRREIRCLLSSPCSPRFSPLFQEGSETRNPPVRLRRLWQDLLQPPVPEREACGGGVGGSILAQIPFSMHARFS